MESILAVCATVCAMSFQLVSADVEVVVGLRRAKRDSTSFLWKEKEERGTAEFASAAENERLHL